MIKKIAGIIAVLCMALAIIYICRVGQPLVFERDTSLSFDLPTDTRDILYYASLAPSGHNTQPWKISYNKQTNTFTLSFDSRRGLPQVDPHNRESFISLGAFLENWKQAAQAHGYGASISILPEPDSGAGVARIVLAPAEVRQEGKLPSGGEQILAGMRGRHTDKRRYESRPIPEAALKTILEKNRPYLHFYAKGTSEYVWLSRNAVEAMRTQALHEGKRAELADWLRFSDAEARLAKDGLPAEQLGLTGPIKALFYIFYDRESAAKKSFAMEAIKQTEQQVDSAAGFFVVTGSQDFAGTIRAGMHFERFWLDAVSLGISIHPMSQILEEAPFAGNVMKELNLNEPVQMIVRAGMNKDYGQNNRVRRGIGSFVFLEK